MTQKEEKRTKEKREDRSVRLKGVRLGFRECTSDVRGHKICKSSQTKRGRHEVRLGKEVATASDSDLMGCVSADAQLDVRQQSRNENKSKDAKLYKTR